MTTPSASRADIDTVADVIAHELNFWSARLDDACADIKFDSPEDEDEADDYDRLFRRVLIASGACSTDSDAHAVLDEYRSAGDDERTTAVLADAFRRAPDLQLRRTFDDLPSMYRQQLLDHGGRCLDPEF